MSDYSTEASVTVNAIQGSMTGITALESGLVSINNQVQDIGRAITAQGNIMDTMIASVGVVAAVGAAKAAEAFGEVEQGMKIAQMVSQQTTAEIKYLTDQANQFSVRYRTDIDQITEGLQTLGRAGLNSATEQSEVLENGLQTAKLEGRELNGVLEELIQNTALLGGDLKSNKFGEQTDYINNLLVSTSMSAPIDTHDVSETLKYSGGMLAAAGGDLNTAEGKKLIEDYMGAVSAFAQKGVTGSIAGTALRAFFNKPATQDKSVLDGLAALNLDPSDLWEDGGERMKPVSDQIGIIQNQMDKLNISTMDQMQIWSKIVGGKMGQQMMKLKSGDIKELTKDIQDSADAEEMATKSMQTYEGAVKEMQETAALAFRDFGERVAMWLGPLVKVATTILKLFTNPVGSFLLFEGFIAILSKTVSIGIRYIRTFAADLKATLAGVQAMSNQIIDSSVKTNAATASMANKATASQKVKENNIQQAQQKEAVNRVAVERTSALEKAKAMELKNEISNDVQSIHNLVQRNINETATNIKSKVSSAIQSSTSGLKYLNYNEKGKLTEDKSFNRTPNFSGAPPTTVVNPPKRISDAFTAHKSSITKTEDQFVAQDMLAQEQQFEKELAEIQQKRQRVRSISDTYYSPVKTKKMIGELENERAKAEKDLEKHMNGIRKHELINKLAYEDVRTHQIGAARAAAFGEEEFYSPMAEKREKWRQKTRKAAEPFNLQEQLIDGEYQLVSNREVNKRTVTSQVPMFRGSKNHDGTDFIIDYSKLVKQNKEAVDKLPEELQKAILLYDAKKSLNTRDANWARGGITTTANELIKTDKLDATLADIDAIVNNIDLARAIEPSELAALSYNKAASYIENRGIEQFDLMMENEKAMVPVKEEGIQLIDEQISKLESENVQREKNIKTMLASYNAEKDAEKDYKSSSVFRKSKSEKSKPVGGYAGSSFFAGSGVDAYGNSTMPTHRKRRIVDLADSTFISAPAGGKYSINIKEYQEAMDEHNQYIKRVARDMRDVNRNRLYQTEVLKNKPKTPTTFLYKPPSDEEISKQIKSLQIPNNTELMRAKSQIELSAEERKRRYISENIRLIGQQRSLSTAISNNEKNAALERLGYEKKVTAELEKQRMLTASDARNLGQNPFAKDSNDKYRTKPDRLDFENGRVNELQRQQKTNDFIDRLFHGNPRQNTTGQSDENLLGQIASRNRNPMADWNQGPIEASRWTKSKDWFKKQMGIGEGESVSSKFKGLTKEGGALSGVMSKVTGGFASLIGEVINPATLAIGGVTAAIDVINGLHDQYISDLSTINDNLEEAINKRNQAEDNLKQAYESHNPDATDEQKDDFILAMYKKIDDQGSNIDEYLNQFNTKNTNALPKFSEDEEGNITQVQEEGDEGTPLQNISANMQELIYANTEIANQTALLTSKMTDPIWGIDGLSSIISKGFEDLLQSIPLLGEKGPDGEFMYTGQLQGDTNDMYNNDLASQMVANMDTDTELYTTTEGIRKNLESWFGKNNIPDTYWQDSDNGMSDILGVGTSKQLYSLFPEDFKTMNSYGKTMSQWRPDERATVLSSWKQDSSTWSKLAKEVAKETRKQTRNMSKDQKKNAKLDFKNNKRIAALVSKIQRGTGRNLSKQTILQAQSMVQLKDMQELSQNVIKPLQESQAQSGLQSAASALNLTGQMSGSLAMQNSLDGNVQLCAAYLAICAQAAAFQTTFYEAKANGTTNASNAEEFADEMYNGYKKGDTWGWFTHSVLKDKYATVDSDIKQNRGLTSGAMAEMAVRARYPNLNDAQVENLVKEYAKKGYSDFGPTMVELTKMAKNGYADMVEKLYMSSNPDEDSKDGSGGGGSDGGGSGGGGSGDKSGNTGTKKERVDLVLCNKKQIPKLDVNLFKKAPQFTILNKNFRLRDIKISTKDKPKAVLDSIKNAIIDTQQRMDPKIVQDEEAEYNPAEATDGKSLPAGSTKTKTK